MTMPIGPFVNGSAVVLGGLLGAWMGAKLPERVRTSLNPLFGLTSIGLGVMSIPGVKYYAAVVLAAVLGLVIGELCYLEKGIGKAAGSARGLIDKIFPPKEGISQEEFLDKYVAIVVLFCGRMDGREIARTRAHQPQSAIRPDFHRPGRDEHPRREILCRRGAGRRARPRDW